MKRLGFALAAATLAAGTVGGAEQATSAADPPQSRIERPVIDVEGFRVLREIPAGPAGLVSLEMDAAALAHSAGPTRSFSDVRIIDDQGKQVPYLVEQCVSPLVLDLTMTRQQPTGDESVRQVSEYLLVLPYPNLPAPRVTLATSARVFARRVTVGRTRAADRAHRDAWFETLAEAQWRHDDETTPAPSKTLVMPVVGETDIVLRVEEGDNAPLPITSAKLVLPGYRLRFYRAENERLRLAYGRRDLDPPRYDIQLLAADVLGRPATDIRASAEPAGAGSSATPQVSRRLFWSVLGLAVVVLLGMAVRLARRT